MSRIERPHAYSDSARGPRLQKVLAEAGVGSRRVCEALIEEGVVSINGTVITTLPIWVDPAEDRIKVRGKLISRASEHIYVMFFKPRGVVCTNDDPEGRRKVIDLVRHPSKARLFPVGRLDLDSSGLLLLTNDGAMANQLTHPRYHLPKIYEVTVRGAIEDESLRRIERGFYMHDHQRGTGKRTAKSNLTVTKRDRDRTRMILELHEGRNRQIRRMMLEVGHPVKKLRRIQVGPLKLKGLRPGQWRDLMHDEIVGLRHAIKVAQRPATRSPKRKRS